ncbi:jg11979 [Pararge aegeria aegeria]|uniref:Jg11979 protein n=1 Tax=Pararge aegeria aegeria TaxID=348720 RepID=A0A8S4SME2_9NEOP|nr:jg11979 [Pararge aegeria aegeria]
MHLGPAPDVEHRRRRPKHVLYDQDDQITTDNVSQHTTNTASSPAKTRAPISDVIRTWILTTVTRAFGLNND